MAVSTDTSRVAIVAETELGTTPDTPAFKVMPITSESLAFAPTTTNSSQLNPTRAVPDSILVGGGVGGDLNFELLYDEAILALIEATLGGSWAEASAGPPVRDELIVGQSLRSFTIEKRFLLDDTPTYKFHRWRGCVVQSMSLSISPGDPVTVSFTLLGKDFETGDAEVTGATYANASSNPVMTAPKVTDISVAGFGTAPCLSSMGLTLNSNARGLECIGTFGFDEVVLGRNEATFQGSFYFGATSLLDDLRLQTDLALSFQLNDSVVPPNSVGFTLPRSRLTSDQVLIGGTNQDVAEEIAVTGLLSEADASNIIVHRLHPA